MIILKKCPCCKSSIFVWRDTVCKCIENYKCYYCPKCKKQITLAKEVKEENHIKAIAITAIVIFLVSLVDEKDQFLIIGIITLGILFFSSILGILFGLLRPLDCLKSDCDEEIKRDNSDLWGSDIPFMKMDSIEKENFHKKTNFAVSIGGYSVLIFIVFGVIVALIKYVVG